MNIEKLSSGSYRIRMQYKKKMYRIVVDHKPTQKEALQLMADLLDQEGVSKQPLTFENAANQYIDSKKNVISPSTIRSYRAMLKSMSAQFKGKLLSQMYQADVQEEINRLCEPYEKLWNGQMTMTTRSPKTIRNYHGFISCVISFYEPSVVLHTTLPQRKKSTSYIPSTDDVRIILEHITGTEYEIPIKLACYGLRRSEICALTIDDLDGDLITINKAKVKDDTGKWVIKNYTKTTSSERTIPISMSLADKIRERGSIYDGYPDSITIYLNRLTKRLGMPKFSIHKLRHYFASILSGKIPDEDIMALGGWSSDFVMKTVYRHAMEAKTEEGKRKAIGTLNDILFQ